MLIMSLSLWIQTKNVEKALKTLNALRKYPDAQISAQNIINLAVLLVVKDRLIEAKQLIEYFEAKKKGEMVPGNCMWNLLNAAAEYSIRHNEQQNNADQFLKILMSKGFCGYLNDLYCIVIREYIDKNQIQEAVTIMEECAKKFKKTPSNGMLLSHLIELTYGEKKSESTISKEMAKLYLLRTTNAMKSVHGPQNANSDVIVTFARSKNEIQLRKMLMEPEMEFNSKQLFKTIIFFKGQSRIDTIITIARSARGLNHETLSEKKLYEFVLDDYVHSDDYVLALQLYEEIQKDEKSVISEKFCQTLVELLTKHKQSIPDTLK